jgi:spermidine synthase
LTSERRNLALRLLTVFIVGFVSLTLEIAYTRVISFKLFYYYTYFVIGLALLGIGAGSTVVALSSRLRNSDTLTLVRIGAPITAVIGVVSYAIVARLATNTDQIWVASARVAIAQVARLMVLSISLTAVFFALGLILAKLIVAEAREVRRLYFWDLTGAALACLFAVPLQMVMSPPSMILGSMAVLALLGLGVALATGHGRVSASVATAAIVVVAIGATTLNVRPDDIKTLKETDEVVAGDWGAVFRVDVVDLDEEIGAQVLIHDGLWGSGIWRYDGTPATTDRFATDSRRLAFDALDDEPARILIIGAAGGNEIQAALTYGVGKVDAVELNPITVDLLRDEFAEYSGNIANHPDVNYVQGDGRTFLARSNERYDLIWFVAPDSYAASNAATSGAFVLSESYLYTESMIQEAFDHLSDTGMIVAQFGDFDFENRPTRTARYLVTARSALDGEIDAFDQHTALIIDEGEFDLGRVSTIMIGRSAFTPDSVERILGTVGELPASRTVHLPGVDPLESITVDIIRSTDDELTTIVDGYRYNISTVTDDKPFFWHFTPFSDVITDWSRGIEDTEIAIGERLLLVLLFIAAFVAALLLWLPFLLTRRQRGATEPVQQRRRLFFYFAALGLGFMLVEISMIQRFALLLGYPTLSLSVSLFTLLIATAIGARYSAWVRRKPTWGLPAVSAVLCVVTLLYLVISDPITEVALAWGQPARIALVIVLLFPVGLLLGMYLPYGIDLALAAADRSRAPGDDTRIGEGRLVAWCWAVNGFFSVIGSLLTTMLSMTFGFNRTLVLGLVLYLVAAAVARSTSIEGGSPETVLLSEPEPAPVA